MFGPKSFARRGSLRVLAISLAFNCLIANATPPDPTWWHDGYPPVIDLTASPDNHGLASIGQAKWMVSEALRALDAIAPQIATDIRSDLNGTSPSNRIVDLSVPISKTPEWIEKQKAPLLIGQLKAIAAPFYLHLHESAPNWLAVERAANHLPDTGTFYPWTTDSNDDANLAPATIGQLKAVFSLHFETLPSDFLDEDGDGMDDRWELNHGLDPTDGADAYDDPDNDLIENRYEYILGFDPQSSSTGVTPDFTTDRDGDGMPDSWEVSFGWFQWNSSLQPFHRTLDWETPDGTGDLDNDGLNNSTEYQAGTHPQNYDTDYDYLPDGWEFDHGLDPNDGVDASEDPDGDGIENQYEYVLGFDPNSTPAGAAVEIAKDSDGDGMPDWWEASTGHFDWNSDLSVFVRGLDWEIADSNADFDGDGLTNIAEYAAHTKPHVFDTDDDGLPDGFEEKSIHLDPCHYNDPYADSDGDGMSDLFESIYDFDPDVNDSTADPDEDGLSNAQEAAFGSDPTDADIDCDGLNDSAELDYGTDSWNSDSDGDTLPDKWEIDHFYEPTDFDDPDSDTDNDGLSLYREYRTNTNPALADTDGDGTSDGDEVAARTDPCDPEWGGTPPAAPGNVTVVVNPDGSTTVNWHDNSTNEAGFHIYLLQPDNTWSLVGSVPANTHTFTKP